ncbi:hypothetical protein FJY94_02440 [Candidatus Kaiserbacteria bacterium]|nr:hypothetical protein [Candidatus Kaiserbacteria bacterium]
MTSRQNAVFWASFWGSVIYSGFLVSVLFGDWLNPHFGDARDTGGIASATTSNAFFWIGVATLAYRSINAYYNRHRPDIATIETLELAADVIGFIAPYVIIAVGVFLSGGALWWVDFKWAMVPIVLIGSIEDLPSTWASAKVLASRLR